jgi:hypothetical protein
MGLLDDAIREHLELKRQHGADPSEVARQERAALAPVHDDEDPETADPAIDGDGVVSSGARNPADADGEDKDLSGPNLSSAIQETAEIDMRTVIESVESEDQKPWSAPDREPREANMTPAPTQTDRPISTSDTEGDALAREAPGKRMRGAERRPMRGRTFGGELPAEGSLP